MFSKKLKSDYISLFNKQNNIQPLPVGYPCTFNTDCQTPSVCQFNVCTTNIIQEQPDILADVCKGKSILDCAKQMQKDRETTEIPIFNPNQSSGSGTNAPFCKIDKDCNNQQGFGTNVPQQVCISGVCLDKKNFPLIARQKHMNNLKSSIQTQVNNSYNKNFNENAFFQQGFGTKVPQQGFGTKVPQQGFGTKVPQQGFGTKVPQQGFGTFVPQHKKTPLDGTLSAYEKMFIVEELSSRNLIEQSSEIRGNDNNGRKLKNSNVFDDYIYM
jgi:hypothetical protein